MKTLIVIALVFLALSHHAHADEFVRVKDIWINEAPPTIRVFAGYMTIENHSDEEIMLINATSPVFEKIEFHQTRYENGMATMNRQENIIIPAGDVLTFSPGGYHLMLFNNNLPITASDNLLISLEFANGIKKTVTAEIRKHTAVSHHH